MLDQNKERYRYKKTDIWDVGNWVQHSSIKSLFRWNIQKRLHLYSIFPPFASHGHPLVAPFPKTLLNSGSTFFYQSRSFVGFKASESAFHLFSK